MNSVNKTLYIPLYGKAYVSKKGLFLKDKMAEEIWKNQAFALKGKSKSKWLAYFMGVRSAVMDEWLTQQMDILPKSVIIHIGCGMDSRVMRVGTKNHKWYDVDFFEVIEERKKYYTQNDDYKMIAGDVRDTKWLSNILETKQAIIVMEGVSMYLTAHEMHNLTQNLCDHFDNIAILVDSYTCFGAKMSKLKNPVNDVGVTKVYGIDDPKDYQCNQLAFVKEHTMIPQKFINQLTKVEKFIFAKLYAGNLSKKLYRMYEYKK